MKWKQLVVNALDDTIGINLASIAAGYVPDLSEISYNGAGFGECYTVFGLFEGRGRFVCEIGCTQMIEYEQDQKHGTLVSYDDATRRVRQKITYVHGKRHGLDQVWYRNGMRKSVTMFVNDAAHGMSFRWRKNEKGELCESTMFANGKKHGVEFIWYANTDLLHYATMYHEGIFHGLCLTWDRDGQLQHQTKYDHDIIAFDVQVPMKCLFDSEHKTIMDQAGSRYLASLRFRGR